ncbi:MAG: hypothetical protein UHS41_07400 [Lachnospiraceae bacterium]|nr:hypothetical protein [Lachnospiraceae bacterium]
MQALLSELVSYLIKYGVMIFAAFAGVKVGIHLRKNKSNEVE